MAQQQSITQRPIIFGEVLFDRFPDGRLVLGGAPFNVAWNLQALGASPLFISRVGADALGAQVQQIMADWGMDLSGLQEDPSLPTGVVDVTFVDGEPHYTIVHPAAYDAISADALPALEPAALLYHGTLIYRDPRSAAALRVLREQKAGAVFIDVNLRQPWWNMEDTGYLLTAGKWIKLNKAELEQIVPAGQGTADCVHCLMAQIDLAAAIVTQGAQGAMIITRGGEYLQLAPPKATTVVDTVGAGDGFSSVVLLGLLRGWSWQESLERAQAFASAIVGLQGATTLDKTFYQSFVTRWT